MCGLDLHQSQKEYGTWNNTQVGKIQCDFWNPELHELTQSADSKWSLYGFSNLQTKKSTPQPLQAAHGAYRVAHQGHCRAQQQWHGASERRTQPAAPGRITSVSEESPMFCQGDNHNLLPQKLLSQIQSYRLKLNSQDKFFHSLSTRAILDKRPWHKESCVQATFWKKDRKSNMFLTNHTN